MKHVRRYILNGLTVLSLLLALATAGLWVRSDWIADLFGLSRPSWAIYIESGGGQFRFEITRATATRDYVGYSGFAHSKDKADGPLRDGMRVPGQRAWIDRWKFWIVTGERWGDEHVAVFAPAWFVLLGTVIMPALWLAQQSVNELRHIGGHCPACGYDTRANPARCSECGYEPKEDRGVRNLTSGPLGVPMDYSIPRRRIP